MMTDRDLWLLACQILEQDGPRACDFVADRISESLTQGDRAGVDNWRAVSGRLNELLQFDGALD